MIIRGSFTTNKFPIDKSIPIEGLRTKTSFFPLDDMEVGDSFLAPLSMRNNLTAYLSRRKMQGYWSRFTTRSVGDGKMRVWRIR